MIAKKETKETITKKNKKEENKKGATVENAPVADNTLDNDGRVGTMLRETRLQKGEDLGDISRKLHIRLNYLEAIENSRYSEVPEAPYGPGFVRSYADYLGLNAVRMAQLYKEETDAKNAQSDMYVPEPESEATAPSHKYILISLLAIALAYGGWNYYVMQTEQTIEQEVATKTAVSTDNTGDFTLQVEEIKTPAEQAVEKTESENIETNAKAIPEEKVEEKSSPQEEPKNNEVQPAAEEKISEIKEEQIEEQIVEESQIAETKTEPKAEEKKQEPIPAPASIDTDVKVVLKANQETWIEAKDADKLYISKVVQAGYTYNVPDKEGMIISTGRYDAVDVYVNGKLTPVFTANKKTGIKVDEVLEQAEND